MQQIVAVSQRYYNLPKDVRNKIMHQAAEEFRPVYAIMPSTLYDAAVKFRIYALSEQYYTEQVGDCLSGRTG